MAGRIEAAVGYSDAGQEVIGSGRAEVPFGLEGVLGGSYVAVGQPERWIRWCRAQLARGLDTHGYTTACLVILLTVTGSIDDAMAAANGLIDAAEAPATRARFRLRFSPTAWPFMTPTLSARLLPCAVAW